MQQTFVDALVEIKRQLKGEVTMYTSDGGLVISVFWGEQVYRQRYSEHEVHKIIDSNILINAFVSNAEKAKREGNEGYEL